MCSPRSPDLRIQASPALPGVRRVRVDKVVLGYVDAVEGVLVGLEQPAGVGRRAQQIGTFAKCGVVLGGDQDGIAVPGDDLDGVVRDPSGYKVTPKRSPDCGDHLAGSTDAASVLPPRPRLDRISGVGESAERWIPRQESASPEDPAETAMSA